jgi:phosphoglycerate dehydrogenase-like enzyme
MQKPESSSRMIRNTLTNVYLDNSGDVPPVFVITEKLVKELRGKHPALGDKFNFRIGRGPAAFAEGMREADVLVGWNFPRSNLRTIAPRLHWIQLIGAGVDHLLPLNWLPSDIALTRASGAHRPKADEFMMLSLLALNNRMPEIASNQRKRLFEYIYCTPIAGKTALLVGLGATGSAAAASCRKLGMTVLAVRQTNAPHPDADEVHGPDALSALLPRADFVIVTVPKTSRTVGLIGRAELELMKPGAAIINLARLGVVDEEAMMEHLDEGHLSGVVYDIQDPKEVPSPKRLWTTDNLMLIPHSLNNDPERFLANALSIFFDNLDRYISGAPLLNRVDPTKEY